MSIANIMSSSLSALQANQSALRATSTNVANVNTEGYTRLESHFVSRQSQGGLYGVEIDVERVANKYLAAAEMRSASDVSEADIVAAFMDRAQGLLGDPSEGGSVFSTFDGVLDAFGALAVDPAANLRRGNVLSTLMTMSDQLGRTSIEINALRDEANARLGATVGEANSLMKTIASLNANIQRATVAGADASQAESEQSRMLDRLSELVDIRVEERNAGGINVRTTDGFMLVDSEAATFSLSESSNEAQYGRIQVKQPHASTTISMESHLQGGELQGLLRSRDIELADLSASFGEYAAGIMDAVNAAHNDAAAVPAPNALTGVNTGLGGSDLHGMSGIAHIAVLNTAGQVQRSIAVDFDALGATATIDDMVTSVNAALGGDATASFSNGVLSLGATDAANGVVIRQDEASPSDRAGRGFSHFFGLNNIVGKTNPTNFATGLTGSSPHGFTTGDTMTFEVRNENGTIVKQAEVAIPAPGTVLGGASAGTMNELLTHINNSLSVYGSFALDGEGRLEFSSRAGMGDLKVDLMQDETTRFDTGLSATQVFGLNDYTLSMRAQSIEVGDDFRANPSLIAAAQPDIAGAAVGFQALSPGDGRGASLLEATGSRILSFGSAGAMNAQSASINDYGARLAGLVGSRATASASAADSALALRQEVASRRESAEGVNIDEELVKMTQYQQAYAAASRMIQATQDLYDTLLRMV